MALLAIYSISAVLAYYGVAKFQSMMQDIVSSNVFSNEEKNKLYDLCLLLHSHGGLLVAIPIVNFFLAFVLWYVIFLHHFGNN